ncbi:InlB B-repeat-containing protein [Psychrobacillus sp. NPDC058041]|uniref:InlB B-repeat-containing protein n=1 Tax=Psychrobacillus sp. NPDC058041 TaxID=3346310 RepID=UPI0036DD5F68
MFKKIFALLLIVLIVMNNVNMPVFKAEESNGTIIKFEDPSKLVKNSEGFEYNSSIDNVDYSVKYNGMYGDNFTFVSNGSLIQLIYGSPVYTLDICFSEEVDVHKLDFLHVGGEGSTGRLIDFTTDTGKKSIGNNFSSSFLFNDFQKIKKLTIKVYSTDNSNLYMQFNLGNIEVSLDQSPAITNEISINTSEQQAINNYTFSNLLEGYKNTDIHEETFIISKKTGNEINNITAEIDGDKFTLGNLSETTLNDENPTVAFTLKPIVGLSEGTYTSTVTITADGMEPVTITVQLQVTKEAEEYKAVSAGLMHSLAIKTDGTVWSFGRNDHGQLGDGTKTDSDTLIQVKKEDGEPLKAVAVAAGTWHSLVLDEDGIVWGWGENGKGTLATGGSTQPKLFPVQAVGLPKITAISSTTHHALAIDVNNQVWIWGDNSSKQLGNGNGNIYSYFATPQKVKLEDGSELKGQAVEAGQNQSLVIDLDGTVWHWGTTTDLTSMWPVIVTDSNNQILKGKQVTAGNSYFSVLQENGDVWTVGDNYFGQLGNGSKNNISVKQAVKTNISDVKAIDAGYGHTIAIKNDGTVWGWGDNSLSPLGDLTNTKRNLPVQVKNLDGSFYIGATSVSAGGVHFTTATHTLSIKNGQLVGWGSNRYGQLGIPISTITKDYAEYEYTLPKNVTVSFNTNGGTVIEPKTIPYNTPVSIPQEPTKLGATFLGWYENQLSDPKLDPTYDFTQNVSKYFTLYALWEEQERFQVSFDSQGGNTVPKITEIMKESVISEPTKPTKVGYTFVGWYTDANYTTKFDFTTPITQSWGLYAKWKKNSSPTPDPTPNGPTVEDIIVDVVDDLKPDELLVRTTFTRTRDNNSVKDNVIFTPEKAKESVQKLDGKEMKISRIVIPDTKDEVTETTVNVPLASLNELIKGQTSLSISTENVMIMVPKTSLETFNDNLYFHVVPVKKEQEKQVIETRAKQESKVKEVVKMENAKVQVLGRPMMIETNMQSRPVTLTLPLPANATQQQMDNLAVFIEHSNGKKEVIRGSIVDYKKGVKGVEFNIDHFSTFTILYLEGAAKYFATQNNSCTEEKAIGCIQAKKVVPIYTIQNNRLKKETNLEKAKVHPVYEKISPMLGLGGDIWVERTDAVLYETPSKDMLLKNETTNDRPMWKGLQMKPGQIGKITVLKDTVIWENINKTKKIPRILRKGEQYRVYRYVPALYVIENGKYVEQQPKVQWISK